jgi:hypothetical protein
MKNTYIILVGMPEGKIPFGGPRRSLHEKIILKWILKKDRT